MYDFLYFMIFVFCQAGMKSHPPIGIQTYTSTYFFFEGWGGGGGEVHRKWKCFWCPHWECYRRKTLYSERKKIIIYVLVLCLLSHFFCKNIFLGRFKYVWSTLTSPIIFEVSGVLEQTFFFSVGLTKKKVCAVWTFPPQNWSKWAYQTGLYHYEP